MKISIFALILTVLASAMSAVFIDDELMICFIDDSEIFGGGMFLDGNFTVYNCVDGPNNLSGGDICFDNCSSLNTPTQLYSCNATTCECYVNETQVHECSTNSSNISQGEYCLNDCSTLNNGFSVYACDGTTCTCYDTSCATGPHEGIGLSCSGNCAMFNTLTEYYLCNETICGCYEVSNETYGCADGPHNLSQEDICFDNCSVLNTPSETYACDSETCGCYEVSNQTYNCSTGPNNMSIGDICMDDCASTFGLGYVCKAEQNCTCVYEVIEVECKYLEGIGICTYEGCPNEQICGIYLTENETVDCKCINQTLPCSEMAFPLCEGGLCPPAHPCMAGEDFCYCGNY